MEKSGAIGHTPGPPGPSILLESKRVVTHFDQTDNAYCALAGSQDRVFELRLSPVRITFRMNSKNVRKEGTTTMGQYLPTRVWIGVLLIGSLLLTGCNPFKNGDDDNNGISDVFVLKFRMCLLVFFTFRFPSCWRGLD